MHLAVQHKAKLVYGHATETKETNIANKRNRVKNPNWHKADQLAYLQSVIKDLNSGLPQNKYKIR